MTRLLLTDCGPSTEADDNPANHLMGRQRRLKVLVRLICEELKGLYHNNTAKASATAERGKLHPTAKGGTHLGGLRPRQCVRGPNSPENALIGWI